MSVIVKMHQEFSKYSFIVGVETKCMHRSLKCIAKCNYRGKLVICARISCGYFVLFCYSFHFVARVRALSEINEIEPRARS